MFYKRRTKKSISLKVWPFNSQDVAKLYWIDHPYRDKSGDWKTDMYFKKLPEGDIRKCTENWGILNTLIIGRLFKGGKLLSDKELSNEKYTKHFNSEIKRFRFHNDVFLCNEGKHRIITFDSKEHLVYKNAFISKNSEYEYHIPVIEVIRTLLAKNRRLIHSILHPNSLNYFFIPKKDYYDENILHLHFSEEYPSDLLSDKHISHLAWLSTNRYAKKAWSEVYSNYLKYGKGLYFSFPLRGSFNIKARYRQKGNIIRIEEIINVSGDTIDYKTVIVHSPHIKQIRINNKPKKKSIVEVDNDEDLIINSNNKGTRKKEDIIEIPIAEHEFENQPIIKKITKGVKSISTNENEDTEKIFISNDNEVSTSEAGEQEIVNGLEFKEKEDEFNQRNTDIRIFILVLNEMDKMYDDLQINFHIKDLPEGKSFSKLDDGITPRQYIYSKITFYNEKSLHILEIERGDTSLSTLVLYSNKKLINVIWQKIVNKILDGLINQYGTWDSKYLLKLKEKGIRNKRIRHTSFKKEVKELSQRLYDKLILILN